MPRYGALPPNLPPRLIPREAAAAYASVSPGTFDKMVEVGNWPKPKSIGRRRLWDVRELDAAIAALPHVGEDDDDANPWDEVLNRGPD